MDEQIIEQPRAKRVYVPPTLIRVRLNPEQAVLSTCSTDATTNLANVMNRCDSATIGDMINCRKSDDGGSADFAAAS